MNKLRILSLAFICGVLCTPKLNFVNFNGFSVPTSSESDLILTLTSPLGGSVTHIATSEADYNIFGAAASIMG